MDGLPWSPTLSRMPPPPSLSLTPEPSLFRMKYLLSASAYDILTHGQLGTRDTLTAGGPLPGPTNALTSPRRRLTSSWKANLCFTHLIHLYRKKIFLLGPSHHVYLKGCVVSTCTALDTPLGSLTVDTAGATYILLSYGCCYSHSRPQ
jgi:hypothetical protein